MRETHARVGAVGLAAVLLTVALGLARGVSGDSFIVEDGKAEAQIVVAETPPRMVNLAARELRLFVMKMTGAELPIVDEPGDVRSIKIYVGESKHTDKLGVSAEGLRHGAFRMDSGDRWLALVGDDYDYQPREPMPRSHGDSSRAQKAWEALTGSTWLNPMAHTYKAHNREFGYWQMDQGGSLNAVYDFLRSLGVRWYLPGELGEVVPRLKSIPLPSVRKTVRPSFALRCLKWTSYTALDWDDLIWDVDQDIDAVLDEYYRLFYGPAAKEMKAALEFADDSFPAKGPQARVRWMPPMEVRARFVEMLHAARAAAGDTVYGRRVQLILDELPPLEQLRLAAALAQQRGDDACAS